MVKENKMVQTEIGLLPEEWEVKTLGDLGDVIIGLTYSPKDVSDYGSLVLRSSNIQNGRLAFDNNVFVKMDLPERVIVQENDLLICVRNGSRSLIGKCALIDKKTEGSAFGAFMSIYRSILNNYISTVFKSDIIQKQIENNLGATINQITSKDLKSFQIPLPLLPEQEAIASALSDVDAWIESLEQLIAKKCLIKQGAMQELLTPKEDWEVKKLGEVATILGGGTPSTFVSEYWNGKIEWFTPTEVGYSKYLYSSKRKISKLGFKNASANLLPKNSILLTTRAGIGDLGILKIEACTNQGFQSIVCNENIDFEFIYYLMSTKKDDLLRNASGSTFLEISPSKVKSLEIQIPSLTEQTRIATILSDMDAELEALATQLEKAKKIKQGMMQELLTGRIRLV